MQKPLHQPRINLDDRGDTEKAALLKGHALQMFNTVANDPNGYNIPMFNREFRNSDGIIISIEIVENVYFRTGTVSIFVPPGLFKPDIVGGWLINGDVSEGLQFQKARVSGFGEIENIDAHPQLTSNQYKYGENIWIGNTEIPDTPTLITWNIGHCYIDGKQYKLLNNNRGDYASSEYNTAILYCFLTGAYLVMLYDYYDSGTWTESLGMKIFLKSKLVATTESSFSYDLIPTSPCVFNSTDISGQLNGLRYSFGNPIFAVDKNARKMLIVGTDNSTTASYYHSVIRYELKNITADLLSSGAIFQYISRSENSQDIGKDFAYFDNAGNEAFGEYSYSKTDYPGGWAEILKTYSYRGMTFESFRQDLAFSISPEGYYVSKRKTGLLLFKDRYIDDVIVILGETNWSAFNVVSTRNYSSLNKRNLVAINLPPENGLWREVWGNFYAYTDRFGNFMYSFDNWEITGVWGDAEPQKGLLGFNSNYSAVSSEIQDKINAKIANPINDIKGVI